MIFDQKMINRQVVGLENTIHQCLRITVNWKCHFSCNYCYVPQLVEARKQKYGSFPDDEIDLASYENFFEKLFEYYRNRYELTKILPAIPLSFCASDPPRSLELQAQMIEKVRFIYKKYFDFLSFRDIDQRLMTTIILDIHKPKAFERFVKLLKRVRMISKDLYIWTASTLWIFDTLKDKEIQTHLRAKSIAEKYGISYCVVLTPSTTKDIEERTSDDFLEIALKAFTTVSKIHQYMATINIAVPILENFRSVTISKLNQTLKRTFVEFYDAYVRINLLAFAKKNNFKVYGPLKETLKKLSREPEFELNSHYVVCEIGIIPGLSRRENFYSFNSVSFGCFSTINCYTGILGLEPSGYISACQFGHDELSVRMHEISDYRKQVLYSSQRIRNIRKKLQYPFSKKSCDYKQECFGQDCSSFVRGACPVDLYFNNYDYELPSYTCSGLVEATDRQIKLIQEGLRINAVRLSELNFFQSINEFQHLIAPKIIENAKKAYDMLSSRKD